MLQGERKLTIENVDVGVTVVVMENVVVNVGIELDNAAEDNGGLAISKTDDVEGIVRTADIWARKMVESPLAEADGEDCSDGEGVEVDVSVVVV